MAQFLLYLTKKICVINCIYIITSTPLQAVIITSHPSRQSDMTFSSIEILKLGGGDIKV